MYTIPQVHKAIHYCVCVFSFIQRWVKRFCTIDGHKLFLKKSEEVREPDIITLAIVTLNSLNRFGSWLNYHFDLL